MAVKMVGLEHFGVFLKEKYPLKRKKENDPHPQSKTI
jgi:hypothetical protein